MVNIDRLFLSAADGKVLAEKRVDLRCLSQRNCFKRNGIGGFLVTVEIPETVHGSLPRRVDMW